MDNIRKNYSPEKKQFLEEKKITRIKPELKELGFEKLSKKFDVSGFEDKGSFILPPMIKIKAGSFKMGSKSGDEKPIHQVAIKNDFYMGKYEVTIAEYMKFVEDTKTNHPSFLLEGNDYNILTGEKDDFTSICLRGDCPMVGVSWNNAKAYTKWLSKKTGHNYTLPSETQWEYTARAGTQTIWSFGNKEEDLKNYAWYSENAKYIGKKHKDYGTHKVGTKEANPWGLYDIHGNAWELCEDWYIDSYKNTPRDEKSNTKREQYYKVVRGGAWARGANSTRSSDRFGFPPVVRGHILGFRLARVLH